MKFWDSTAIIPLRLKGKTSQAMKGLIKDDEDIVVWWGTRIECLSALSRRGREGALSVLASTWSEVQHTETIRLRAERLLSIHPLRAADALQLALALKEGFSVQPPEASASPL